MEKITNVKDDKLSEYLEEVGDEGISRIEIGDDVSIMVVIRKGTYDTREGMEDVKEELEDEFEDAFVHSLVNGPCSFYHLPIPITKEEDKSPEERGNSEETTSTEGESG